MRLLILTTEFPPGPGGIGTHAHQLAMHLERAGWRVLVVASQDYASRGEIEAFNRAQEYRVTSFRPIAVSPVEALYRQVVLGRAIRDHAPDALVATGRRAVLLMASRWNGRDRPWVAVGHGTEFGRGGGWLPAATRWAFQRARAVVCVSEYTRKQMHAFGIRLDAEVVIPNGADPERFRVLPEAESVAVRRELGLRQDARLLLTVGHVTERKGQDLVVAALPEILAGVPQTHYLLAGLPTNASQISGLARQLGVADRVHVLGRVDDARLLRLMNAADLFVMASRTTRGGEFEGYGIAVVEAALCGKPAVVSADSGLAEAIVDAETGLVVPQNDVPALAGAIVALLGDEPRRRTIGERARRRAQSTQTWESAIRRYDELLRDLVSIPRDDRRNEPGESRARSRQ